MKAQVERLSGFDVSVAGGLSPRGLVERLRLAFRVAEERRRLGDLSDRELADLGLTRAEAAAEARRAPWDLPARRR